MGTHYPRPRRRHGAVAAEKECLRAPAACLKAAAQLTGMAARPSPAGKGKDPLRSKVIDVLSAAN
ncbi:MAG: hypothetical protein L0Y50_03980 [Beijerinckiaceae bacterium]|nr:hypothetical protein [Beijerinckiaceae bacterium]MCI0735422.1 hypothetical protein [Beijerinckiaceae bacterium]